MIGLDTNVLVRYLIKDDKKQYSRAEALIDSAIKRKEALHVCIIVLCEVVWVLQYHYELKKEEIVEFLTKLLHAEQIEVESRELALSAFHLYQSSQADFADCLIGVTNQFEGCSITYTFDKKALRLPSFKEP